MVGRVIVSAAFACCALLASACGSGGGGSDSAGSDQVSCSKVPAAAAQTGRQHLTAPTATLPAGSVWDLKVETNCGSFTIQVDTSVSPKASNSVVSLAKSGFYDGLAFHRLVPGFVIQGGDPAGDGSGGPGYKTVDKPDAGTTYLRGTVAMAKMATEAPGTAGSQFFIVTGDDAGLPPEYAVIGKVTDGLTVADLISSQQIDPTKAMGDGKDGPPKEPIVIESVKVSRVS